MFIKKLFIKNLNSLKGSFEIDLSSEVFSNNPIFAITGDIGAGKSTILDAICLALYQKTPRVKSTTKEELNLGQLSTIGTSDSYAKVIFENKGITYRSSWMVGLISRGENAGTWNSPSVDLEIWKNGAFESLPDASKKNEHAKKIEAAIGLNFDQFEKTILLAQGSFSKLLKAKEEERTDIIEKLTGTEEYRLVGKRVFLAANQKKKAIDEKNTFLKGQSEGLLTPEELAEINTKINQLESDKKNIIKDRDALRIEVDKLTQYQLLLAEKKSIGEDKNKLLLHTENIQIAEAKVKRHQTALTVQPSYTEYLQVKNSLHKESETLQINLEAIAKQEKRILNFEDAQLAYFPGLAKENFIPQIEARLELAKGKENDLENLQKQIDAESLNIGHLKDSHQKEQLRSHQIENDIKKQLELQKSGETYFSENTLSAEEANTIVEELDEFNTTIKSWRDKTSGIISLPTLENSQELISELRASADSKGIKPKNISIDSNIQSDYSALKTELDRRHKLLEEQTASWKNEAATLNAIWAAEKEVSTIKSDLQKIQVKQKALHSTLLGLEEQKKAKELSLQASKKEFSASHLSQQDNAVALRSELTDHEPCMVCGSTDHPFSDKDNETLKAFAEQKLLELTWENQLENIKLAIEQNKLDLNKIDAEIKAKNQLSDHVQKTILATKDKLKFTDCHACIPADFELQLQQLETDARKKITEAQNNVDAFLHSLQLSAAHALQTIDNRRNELMADVELKTKNTELKKASLREYADTVTRKTNELQHANARITELKQALEIQHANLQDLLNKKNGFDKNLKALQSRKTLSTKQLKEVFAYPGTTSQYRENKLEELKALINEKALIQDRVTRAERNLKQLQQTLTERENHLELSLKKHTFESKEQFLASLLSDEEYQNLETQVKNHHNKLLALNTALNKIEFDLQKLGDIASDALDKLPILNAKLGDLEQNLQLKNQEFGGHAEKLAHHKKRKEQLGVAQKELDQLKQDALPYYLLNKAIGDAQGKRFANVAARYTFNKLLEFTNYHLKSLKSRYTFAFMDPLSQKVLDLMVMDAQMGNSLRPAKSTLSGGETFLTSLCLALALSDLSSNKVQIKSLFIDEGFGSLDQDSLHEAISLLENLPDTTGKTIGIISHVEALKQRIPTQIQLKKQGNGFSKIKLPN